MNFLRAVLFAAAFGLLGAGIAFLVPRWGPLATIFQPLSSHATLPEFRLTDLDGQSRSSTEWRGKVLLLNFWATWCPPCRKEIPAFIRLQTQYQTQGVQFVGISIDQAEPTQAYALETGINYPVLIGDTPSMALSQRLGNRLQGLPFSALFDRQGKLVFIKTGALEQRILEEKIRALL
ncbi:MAG: TlpA disulfide reductase family protein [Pseudomonadota bacterium]